MAFWDFLGKKQATQEGGRSWTGLWRTFKRYLTGKPALDEATVEDLEEALMAADVGMATTAKLLDRLQQALPAGGPATPEVLYGLLGAQLRALIPTPAMAAALPKPYVVLVVGVNGAGKTTTVAKLARHFAAQHRQVLVGAADTFRAAAVDQLQRWAAMLDFSLVVPRAGQDPAAVAYDTLQQARDQQAEVVLLDTAGRLHTKVPLMDELAKVRRVVAGQLPGAPHEVLLVLDGTTGQNALLQARHFHQAVGVTALAVTKLDSMARGGALLSIVDELGVPLRYVGTGEGPEDLQRWSTDTFVAHLLGQGPGQ